MNKTKVIATISPAISSKEMIKSLIINGVDVIRLNMSYASPEFCREVVEKVNDINKELNTHIATMLDLKGPLIRIGRIANNQAFLKNNDKIRICMNNILGDSTKFSIDYPNLINEIPVNSIIKINDGLVELQVLEKGYDYLLCKVLKEGIITSNTKINIKNIKLNKPFLNEEDKRIIKFAHELDIDFLSLSYARSYEDVLEVNDLLINLDDDNIQIITKIENEQAILDIDNIIKVSDGIMISRNTLSSEVSLEKIPGIQKKIINKCHEAGIINIVTSDLFTTMNFMNPAKAEVSDIANSVIDGVDAVLLSGTNNISNPIETLKILERVINVAEKDLDYNKYMDKVKTVELKDITTSIAYSVVNSSNALNCKAIITPTISGYTAKKISKLRPICPIVAVSPNIKTVKSLSLNFGVIPILIDDLKSMDAIIEKSKKIVKILLALEDKEIIIITGGYPFKKVKHTNFMKVEEI